MANRFYILFCKDPLVPDKVDPDFEEEFLSAKRNGFSIILFDFDELVHNGGIRISKSIIDQIEYGTTVIYRGWMLTPSQYTVLFEYLLTKGLQLINTPIEYQNCHYLPDSLKYIESRTPRTIFAKLTNNDVVSLIDRAKVFGNKPVIIKDFVKSEKHNWETACYVENASDPEELKRIINNFLELRGDYLNEGIVIREFLELKNLTIHSKSGMPLAEEYRLFFFGKKLIGICGYWEEGHYVVSKPDTEEFEDIAKGVDSNFFCMDIARKKDGGWVIIELGDGQVSGLPESVIKNEFYRTLKYYLES